MIQSIRDIVKSKTNLITLGFDDILLEINHQPGDNILFNDEEKLFKKFTYDQYANITELEYVSVVSPANYLKVYHNSDDISDGVITIRTTNHYALINPTTMAMLTPVANWIPGEITYTFRNSGFWYISYYDGTDTQIIKCSVLDDINVPANRTTDFVITGEKAFVADKEAGGRYVVSLESDPMLIFEYDNTGTQVSTSNTFIDITKGLAMKDNGVQNYGYCGYFTNIVRVDQLGDPLPAIPVIGALGAGINVVRFMNEIYTYDGYTGFTFITTI